MTIATVRCIANGYTVNWSGSTAIGVPASLYAGSIAECVYWLGRIFDPVSQPPAQGTRSGTAAPRIVDDTDPLLGQEAQVKDIASGGFLVTQMPNSGGVRMVETYCTNVDAVHAILDMIFAPPVA